MSKVRIAVGVALLAAGLGSTAAYGLPWDLDMVDAQYIRGYERIMQPLPEGVVSQPNVISPKHYVANYTPMSPEAAQAQNPYAQDEMSLALGQNMYGVYCTPCHGDGVNLGPVAAPGRVPAVPVLAGENGVLRMRSDGWVYSTIRNGSISQIMPPYGYTMTDREMWAIVHYMRDQMPDAKFVPPAPAGATAPGSEN